MVAKCKSHTICKALIYLAFLALIYGCDPQTNNTIVTLHFKDPTSLENIIQESLDGDVKYQIANSSIIFFAGKNEIAPTLELLSFLDKGPSLYELQFKAITKNHYTTHPLPKAITLLEGQYTTSNRFTVKTRFKVEPRSKRHSLLIIESKHKEDFQRQVILMSHDQWLEVIPGALPRSVRIKLNLVKEPPTPTTSKSK